MTALPLPVALPMLATMLLVALALPTTSIRRPPARYAPTPRARPGRHRTRVRSTGSGPLPASTPRSLLGLLTRRRRRQRIDATFPDAVEMLVLAVHAGATPAQAVHDVREVVDPVLAPAFDEVAHRMQRGRGLADAIGALVERLGHRAAGVVDAVAAADRYGTPLGPVLDGLALEAREDRRRVGEAHARALSVKLSFPLVVCTLPAFVLLAIVPAVLGALSGLPISPVRP